MDTARNERRYRGIRILFLLLGLWLAALPAAADVYPAEPFNGLQIAYSVSGVNVEQTVDHPGFTTWRELTGSISGGTLTVAGTAAASNGWGADLSVVVDVDGVQDRYTASKFPPTGLADDPMQESFSVSVPIPRGAQSASFVISMSGSYNAGGRGLEVQGEFTGSGSGGSTGSGDGVSDGTETEDGDVSWGVLIGGGIAAVAAAAVAISRAGKGAKGDDERRKKEEQVNYILQLSSDHLAVAEDRPASLTVTVWKQQGASPPVPASDADVRIGVPADVPELLVSPSQGTGTLVTTISLTAPRDPGTVILEVEGSSGGSGTSARVEVDIEGSYILQVT